MKVSETVHLYLIIIDLFDMFIFFYGITHWKGFLLFNSVIVLLHLGYTDSEINQKTRIIMKYFLSSWHMAKTLYNCMELFMFSVTHHKNNENKINMNFNFLCPIIHYYKNIFRLILK